MAAAHADPWRLRCPNGHASWNPVGEGYECDACGVEFDELVDAKRRAADD